MNFFSSLIHFDIAKTLIRGIVKIVEAEMNYFRVNCVRGYECESFWQGLKICKFNIGLK